MDLNIHIHVFYAATAIYYYVTSIYKSIYWIGYRDIIMPHIIAYR